MRPKSNFSTFLPPHPIQPRAASGFNFSLVKTISWDLYSGVRRRRVSPVGLSSHDSSGARNLIFLKYLVAVMSQSVYTKINVTNSAFFSIKPSHRGRSCVCRSTTPNQNTSG